VLTRIRASWNSVALPVVMVTALTDAADVVRALSLGANDYLTKPVDFEVAFARVASQVQRRHDQKRFEHLVAAQRDARELIEAALKERFRQLKADTAAMARTKLDPAQKALLQNIQSCGAELFRTASGALEKATDGTRRAA
jgi:DNA-binding response OmpR family regulator